MHRLALPALLLPALLLATPARAATVQRDLPAFHALCAEAGVEVEVVAGPAPAVCLELSGIAPEDVRTELRDDCLLIAPRPGTRGKARIQATLTAPTLDGIQAAAGASVHAVRPVEGPEAAVSAAAGSRVEAAVQAEALEVTSAAGAEVVLTGTARRLEATAAAGARIDADGLSVEQATATAAAGASIDLQVHDRLTATAAAGGSVHYRGSPPQVDRTEAAGGRVRPRD